MSNVSISTNKLTIGYRRVAGDSHSNEVVIQSDLNFALQQGEMVCMLGPNGCGKSTLLRTLAGLQPALSGEFTHCDSKFIALVLTERLSMENTTVHDVVAMGRYPYTSFLGGLTDKDEQFIEQALEAVGFSITDNRSPITVTPFNAHSDGEKQRILIAKALAQQTPIILLDEPTAHLDLPHRILVLRLLRQLAQEQGKTVLISTHELDLALALSDRIMLMTPNKGIELDTAENLKKADAFTSAFGMDIFNPLG
ncbi:MAG: ABC transporter ATP-binding protein [Paludibacteraceae bacterium]|nr:ABC transporter ATP-binding protein [Paludibacteraceae bacterium]